MLRHLAAITIVLGAVALGGGALAAAPDATGLWSTEGAKAQIRISACGEGALCGTIAALDEPIDPETGRPKTDKNNADPALRNRPLIGTTILLGMKPTDTPNRWEGKVYNAEDGHIYTAYLTVTGPSALKLEGCILAGLICKSQTWSRVKNVAEPASRAR
jgi:uncharacterized protein (DUF2147 family)